MPGDRDEGHRDDAQRDEAGRDAQRDEAERDAQRDEAGRDDDDGSELDPARVRYARHSAGLEFDRVAYFSDAVFAIAMTLLVVGIGIPDVASDGLGDALRDRRPEITSFFISFVVIGNYWLAHHQFFSHLVSVTPRLMTVNLVYLAAIAFAPFPTALAGKYEDRPVSIVMYAITLAVASSLEAVMLVLANRERLFRRVLPPDAQRYFVVAALVPVALFVASIPVAFVSTTLALLSWLLIFPLEQLAARLLRPDGVDEAFG